MYVILSQIVYKYIIKSIYSLLSFVDILLIDIKYMIAAIADNIDVMLDLKTNITTGL